MITEYTNAIKVKREMSDILKELEGFFGLMPGDKQSMLKFVLIDNQIRIFRGCERATVGFAVEQIILSATNSLSDDILKKAIELANNKILDAVKKARKEIIELLDIVGRQGGINDKNI